LTNSEDPKAPAISGRRWADVDIESVRQLSEQARTIGWRKALEHFEEEAPFFVKRLNNFGLANWHLLFPIERKISLDVGCGFGTLAYGVSDSFDLALGVDYLPERIRFARIRALEDQKRSSYMRGTGFHLPVSSESIDMVTLNGVLEWAALYEEGDPRVLQQKMLAECARLVKPRGMIGVAIENRYALETLLGMSDTHTGINFATAGPRFLAEAVSRITNRGPYRTYLYGREQYKRLFSDVPLECRIFDLYASYNDYSLIIDSEDDISYRFLASRGLMGSFYKYAAPVRSKIARWLPKLAGALSYAYLVVGQREKVPSAIDRSSNIWKSAIDLGLDPGVARFATSDGQTGQITLVGHDGKRVISSISICATSSEAEQAAASHGDSLTDCSPREAGEFCVDGYRCRARIFD